MNGDLEVLTATFVLSSELPLEDASEVLRLPLMSTDRFFLFGPRILRSGAYSHFSPRRRQRSQMGCSPLHCKCCVNKMHNDTT